MRLSRAVLTLISVCVMSALVVSAASAATTPEFKPVPTKKKFTASSGIVTANTGNKKLECAKSALTGEITGAATVGHVIEKLTKCRAGSGTGEWCPVNSVGAAAEEIVTKSLEGELGTAKASEAASGVGVMLKPESGSIWSDLVYNRCWGEGPIRGQLAFEVKPIKKRQTTVTLFVAPFGSVGGIEEITLDSGELYYPELIFAGNLSQIGFTQSYEVKFEEALEVT